MNTRTRYTYTVLRYVHDAAVGEFINIGVALHAPDVGFIGVKCRKTYSRLKEAFPTFDGEAFRASMRHVEQRFEGFAGDLAAEASVRSHASSVITFAHAVLAADDSSLQWSPVATGVARDPKVTLEQLYVRLVTSNDMHPGAVRGKHDDDVWRRFSVELEQRQVLQHFEPKTIAVRDDELKFKHAWKNGVWHCLQPLSFDLASAESIKEKAHKWLGQVSSVADASDPFKVYYLVGGPSSPSLRPAFDAAISILKKSQQVDAEVFLESQASVLTDQLVAAVTAHLDQAA
jgi:hypothetical protein